MTDSHQVRMSLSPMVSVQYRCPENGLMYNELIDFYSDVPDVIKCRNCNKVLVVIRKVDEGTWSEYEYKIVDEEGGDE